MKIYAFKIQKESYPFYGKYSRQYGHDLTQIDEPLNELTMKMIPQGVEGVLTTPVSNVNDKVFHYLKEIGVKYIATASAGFEHFDLIAANEFGFKIGRVPAYSPTSVASYAFTTGLELLRKTPLMFHRAKQYDFTVDDELLVKEFRDLTVGIIGTGKIGYETAKYFHNVGFKVLGYDAYPSDKVKEVLEYTDLETLIKESDLISLHMNHVKGVNDNFINAEFIAEMKDGASIVNTARAALVDLKAVIEALQIRKLFGFVTDVINNEDQIIGEHLTENELIKINCELNNLLKLYPYAFVSQHIAYFTETSLANLSETSMKNFKQFEETGTCDTVIN